MLMSPRSRPASQSSKRSWPATKSRRNKTTPADPHDHADRHRVCVLTTELTRVSYTNIHFTETLMLSWLQPSIGTVGDVVARARGNEHRPVQDRYTRAGPI